MFSIDLISENGRSFRTLSNLLEEQQCETALSSCDVYLDCEC